MSRLFLTVTVFLSAFFMVEGLAAQKKSYLPINEIGRKRVYVNYAPGRPTFTPLDTLEIHIMDIIGEDGYQVVSVLQKDNTGDYFSMRQVYEEDGVSGSVNKGEFVPMIDFNLEVGDKAIGNFYVVWKDYVDMEGVTRCVIGLDNGLGKMNYWVEGIGAVDDIYMALTVYEIGVRTRMTECWQGDTCLFRYDDMENYISEVRSIIGENPDAPLYDLYGRRIVAPVPGQLYIWNGRKHIAM